MITAQTTETKYNFANRFDVESRILEWVKNPKIVRIWFTDHTWMKNDSKRYEVIVVTDNT